MDTDGDNENAVLCEKIINDIQAVFLKDPDLCSFEIVPTVLNRNKSPVIHVDHNLGLESWCAKHVYDHAHKTLFTQRKQLQRYLQQSDMLLKYLNVALLINPDVTTFWHIRRQLVQKNRLKVQSEFKFSALILTKKPKSSEAFAYRRWLYSFQSTESIDWPSEIGICERSADRCASNYHAWTHRMWVLQKESCLMKSEILLSEKFMLKHISDYSSYHYRQLIIGKAFEMCFYAPEDLQHLCSLRELINYYLIVDVATTAEMLATLLPDVNAPTVGEQRLKSFLYCCNLAASDIKLCDDQKNMYGARESFEQHRRASLKFIVDLCVRLNAGELDFRLPPPAEHMRALQARYDYSSNAFLMALKRSENLLGEKHRRWCAIFLGFD